MEQKEYRWKEGVSMIPNMPPRFLFSEKIYHHRGRVFQDFSNLFKICLNKE